MLRQGDHVCLVDNVRVDERGLIIDRVKSEQVPHLGGGIYDVIVFRHVPKIELLRIALEKVYWGGVIIIQSVVPRGLGYNVLAGDAGELVIQRPPAPPDWTREYYLEFQPKGREWNAVKKKCHPSYAKKFVNIDVDWKGKRVVEIGCGRGEITRLIAKSGVQRVYAIDKSPAAVALTREFCDDCENVKAVCQDARIWNAPEAVDVIVALDFIEHIDEEDIPSMLRVWSRYLKPGGMVHIVTPLGGDHVRDHRWAPTPKKLKRVMEEAGFREKRHVRPEGSRKFRAEFVKV